MQTRKARLPASSSSFRTELRSLAVLGAPIILSQLGAIGMSTADTVMVGPLGAVPLAAAGVGTAVHIFVLLLGQGVISGMGPLVSQAWGAGELGECRRQLVQGGWVAVAVSLPVMAVSFAGDPIVRALGQDPAVSQLAGDYLLALGPGVLPYYLFMAMRQYLEGMGRARPPMVVTLVALVINVGCNAVLIYGMGPVPALGVAGSGWASTIVRWSMLFMLAGWVVWSGLHPLAGAEWRLDTGRARRIVAVGAPIGGQMGLEVGLFAFAAVMMGWLGPLELAAHQVTINIAATTFMVALGASMAGTIRVGQHIGAGRPHGLRLAAFSTYLLAVGFMGLCALAFVVGPRALVGLYTPDAAIVDLGARLLLIAALFQVFDGAQVAGVGVLRGAADTRTPMIVAALGYWGLGLPVGVVLAFRLGLGAEGIWLGLTAGLATVAMVLAVRVTRLIRDPSTVRRAVAGTESSKPG